MATTIPTMTTVPSESGLLRLAIAKGLLRWEDLDAVADRLPADDDDGGADPSRGRWIRALVQAGLLTPETVSDLLDELREDLTPDYTGRGVRPSPLSRPAAPPPPAPDLAPEFRFLEGWERYHVERLLGSGGMGTVFKAFDPTLGRWVALKFLHRNDASQTERFLREARAQARVDHPNICQVHEVGEVGGRPYIAMRYIEGRSLSELRHELSLNEKVALVRDVARGVHAAHRTGLVHRDLKPGNILVTRDESGEPHPYVVDFGLALEQNETGLSVSGTISGTPAYISPEAAQGRPLDRRTDVYSLGIVLYELLAGAPPFTGGNLARILVRVVQEDPKPLRQVDPAISQDLETVVAKSLEKDPERRYASGRDLAEDLDRFLDGEPVQARPAGWLYRAGKRLRKNKPLAIVSAAALVALLVLGAVSLRAQWQARERAELAQRFGQRIGELETSLLYEAFLPLHDITPRKRALHRELESLRAEMKRIGPIAEGPGNFALGQGYFSLRQYEVARDHLEKAWKAGERSPELAAALGRTLGLIYEDALADASLQTSSTERAARREEIERSYLQPALRYLRTAAQGSQDNHLAALLAYYEKHYPEAIVRAREAYLQSPNAYQAGRIEAAVLQSQGTDAANAGRFEEALALYERSGEVLRRLIRQAPSDPGLYADDCERWASWISAAMAQEDVPQERVAQAIADCGRAQRVDPEMSDSLVFQAAIFWRLSDQKLKRGGDPEADLASSIRIASRAIALAPRNTNALNQLTAAYRLLAQWKMSRGMDARADIEKGLQAARKAVEIKPELASAHSNLGTAYLVLVQDQQRRGAGTREALEKAAESYRRATELNPSYLPAVIGLGNTWKSLSEVQIAQGQDPSASVGLAVAALEKASRLNPNLPAIPNNLGNAHLTLAEYLMARGSDPREALTRAAASYQRAIDLKADYSLARFNLAWTYRGLAEAAFERGEDPGPALATANAALEEYYRLNPTDADVFLERGRLKLLAARQALRRGQDPGPDLRAANTELLRAEELNPEQPEIFFTQAQVERHRAEKGIEMEKSLAEGLRWIDGALAINPGEARYLAMRGLLQARQGRHREAVASLEEALKINPLLRREYGPVLNAARTEAQRLTTPIPSNARRNSATSARGTGP